MRADFSNKANPVDAFKLGLNRLLDGIKNLANKDRVRLEDLRIRDKDNRLVPLIPNEVQEHFLDDVCPMWRSHDYTLRGQREIILKARQQGFSTIIAALLFLNTINNPRVYTIVLAHDDFTSKKLFEVVKRFYDNIPEEKKKHLGLCNREELYWDDIDSRYVVATAGAFEAGRGTTPTYIHASEAAFWANAEKLTLGMFEGVPAGRGAIFVESTANGIGNWYEEEWRKAMEQDSAYRPHFFAWFDHAEYREPLPSDFTASGEENKLKARFDLDDEQIYWRRLKIKTQRKKFPQEYPATWMEAFLASGRPYFDNDKLAEIAGDLRQIQPLETVRIPGDYDILKIERRALHIWEEPIEGVQYAIGADTAEGLVKFTTGTTDGDYDSADVIRCDTGEQVAHLHGKWGTDRYGILLAQLGYWYNTALLCPERNNHGTAVIDSIRRYGYPDQIPAKWGGLYYQEPPGARHHGKAIKQKTLRAGWFTSAQSKTFALDCLATAFDDDDIMIYNEKTVSEMMCFVHLVGGKAGGEGNNNDDRVMSLAIACAIRATKRVSIPIHVPPTKPNLPDMSSPVTASAQAAMGDGVKFGESGLPVFERPKTRVNSFFG